MFHSTLPGDRPGRSTDGPDHSVSLKEAMRRFVGAVSVVTSGEGAARTGATVTTAHSVSMEPPTMLVSLNRASSTFRAIRQTGAFCVNLLGAERQDVAERFSGFGGHAGEARYEGADWSDLVTGSAVLTDALAAIDCRVVRIVEHASHALILGEAEALLVSGERATLLYGRGVYGVVRLSPA